MAFFRSATLYVLPIKGNIEKRGLVVADLLPVGFWMLGIKPNVLLDVNASNAVV